MGWAHSTVPGLIACLGTGRGSREKTVITVIKPLGLYGGLGTEGVTTTRVEKASEKEEILEEE